MSSAAASATPSARGAAPASTAVVCSDMYVPTQLEHTVAEATRPIFEALESQLLRELIGVVRDYATYPFPLGNELFVDLKLYGFSFPLTIPKRHLPESCMSKGALAEPGWLDANNPLFESCKLMMDVSNFGIEGGEDASLTLVIDHPQNRRRYVVQITKNGVPEELQGRFGYGEKVYRVLVHESGAKVLGCLIVYTKEELVSGLKSGDFFGRLQVTPPFEQLVYPVGFLPAPAPRAKA